MSQEMNKIQGSSYSYFAQAPSRTSRLTSFRGYLGQKIAATAGYATSSSSQNTTPRGLDNPEERQGWRAWAGEKARGLRDGLRGSPGAADPGSDNIESITLFPGWAARKYRRSTPGDEGTQCSRDRSLIYWGLMSFEALQSHLKLRFMYRASQSAIRIARLV